jgi:transcription antitermination factor NusG
MEKPLQSSPILTNKATQQKWYAVYCRPRHEKRVLANLMEENIEAYLPLQTTIKQWSDRKKKVSEPLFSCYVFVRIASSDYYRVLNQNGVVRYVTFEGKAISIPEEQIHIIKCMLEQEVQTTEIADRIPAGSKIEIVAGPLSGIKAELVEYAGKKRVVIRIDEINKTVMVNISPSCVKLLE